MNAGIDNIHLLVVHLGRARFMADWNYKNISSPFTRIYYVEKGHAQIQFQDRIQDLRPGYLYIIPAFTLHSCICHEEFCHHYIHIYNESGHDVLEDWDLPTEIPADDSTLANINRLHELCPGMELIQTDPKFYDNSMTLNRRIQDNKQRELYARIESRGIIYLLIAAFLRRGRPKQYVRDQRITRVLDYIRTHAGEKTDVAILASICCLSEDHLIRIFKGEIGMTPLQYINKKKIENAQLQIVSEAAPIKEIAYRSGFEDQTYFNRLFKKHTGMTPVEYRKTQY